MANQIEGLRDSESSDQGVLEGFPQPFRIPFCPSTEFNLFKALYKLFSTPSSHFPSLQPFRRWEYSWTKAPCGCLDAHMRLRMQTTVLDELLEGHQVPSF